MGDAQKPLADRLRDLVNDLVDGVVGALGELLHPAPAPVPIPARGRRR